ncbi:MAG: hypothetical protein Q9207_005038 [Kuettlingeria erythrocarpa]
MSGFEIAAGIVTFVAASRKVVDGISRLSGLRHAPDVLLALNNELADLHYSYLDSAQRQQEDLEELEQQRNNTSSRVITPGFERAVQKTKKLLLDLEELYAYELTTFDDRTGRLRVDRSAWLQTQRKVEKAQQGTWPPKTDLDCESPLDAHTPPRKLMTHSTPRHCLLFHHTEVCQDHTMKAVSQQCRLVDASSVDDILEAPPLHVIYRKQGSDLAFNAALKAYPLSCLEEKDAIGETLLFKAVRRSDLPLGVLSLSDLVQQLFEYGARGTQQNRHGYTCIALACAIGDLSVVRCLLDHGADPMVGNLWNSDSNALYQAVRCNRHTVLEYLFAHQSGYHPKRQNRANMLHCAVSYADVQTLRILSKVRWITTDVDKLLAGVSVKDDIWMPRRVINHSRLANLTSLSERYTTPSDWDREQVFLAFTTLFRAMVDDHYSSISGNKIIQSTNGSEEEILSAVRSRHDDTTREGPLERSKISPSDGVMTVDMEPPKKISGGHRLPLWSTTKCGQRGLLEANTSASLTIWNPPFHLDWAAIESLFFAGRADGYSNSDLQTVHSSVIHM